MPPLKPGCNGSGTGAERGRNGGKCYLSDVGMQGFKILLYGWRIKHHFPEYQFYGRNYMNGTEMLSFSEYAGYDLSCDPQN